MKRKMKHADAMYAKHGNMICERCGQIIKEGLYLYREVYKKHEFLGYFSHFHKACFEDHPIWGNLEEENRKNLEETKTRLDVYLKFYMYWNEDGLCDAIESMSDLIKKMEET